MFKLPYSRESGEKISKLIRYFSHLRTKHAGFWTIMRDSSCAFRYALSKRRYNLLRSNINKNVVVQYVTKETGITGHPTYD